MCVCATHVSKSLLVYELYLCLCICVYLYLCLCMLLYVCVYTCYASTLVRALYSIRGHFILISLCSNVGLENDKKHLVKECDHLKQDLRQAHLEVGMLQARLSAVQNTDEKV